MYKGQSITVITPCLNEEQGIEKVLRGLTTLEQIRAVTG